MRWPLLGIFAAGPIFHLTSEDPQYSGVNDRMSLLMEELQYSISSLFRELEQCPANALEEEALVLHSPHQSAQKIETYHQLKISLQNKLFANTTEAESVRGEIRSFWMVLETDRTFCVAFEKFTRGSKPSTLKRLRNELQLRKDEILERWRDIQISFELQSKVEALCEQCESHYDELIQRFEGQANREQEMNNNDFSDELVESQPSTSKQMVTRKDNLLIKARSLHIEKQIRLAKFYCCKEQTEIYGEHLRGLMSVYDHGKNPAGIKRIIATLEEICVRRTNEVQMLQSFLDAPSETMPIISLPPDSPDSHGGRYSQESELLRIQSDGSCSQPIRSNQSNKCRTLIPYLGNDDRLLNEGCQYTERYPEGGPSVPTRKDLDLRKSQANCLIIRL